MCVRARVRSCFFVCVCSGIGVDARMRAAEGGGDGRRVHEQKLDSTVAQARGGSASSRGGCVRRAGGVERPDVSKAKRRKGAMRGAKGGGEYVAGKGGGK